MLAKVALSVVGAMAVTTAALADSGGPPAPVNRQSPTAADGPPTFQPGMLWLDSHDQAWLMRGDGKPGPTTWVFQDPAAPVIDEVGGQPPLAAYATRRLTSSYAGAAIKVRRISDGSVQDFGFLPDGRLNEPALASFCARTECRVPVWYDQSGNERNATQGNPAAQPVVRLAHRTGDSLSIVWDYEATTAQLPRWLDLPPTLQVNAAGMSILWTGRSDSASLISPILELGIDANPFGFGFWDAHGSFYIGPPDQLAELPGHAPLSASIGLLSSSEEDGIIANYRNQQTHLGALKPRPHAGGYIGRTAAFHQYAMMELSSLVIYGRALDVDARLHAVQALGQNFAIPQQQQDVFVADGDSITQGLGSLYDQSYVWRLERLVPDSLVLYDAAWAAKTLGGVDGLLDRYARFTTKLFNPHARVNIISLLAGTNDLQQHVTGNQVYQWIAQYAAAARQTGFKVIIATILPRATFDTRMEYERIQANLLIRSNWRGIADGLADFAADPVLGAANSTSNGAVYCADGVHPTDYGYQVMAADLAPVVQMLTQE